MMSHDMYFLCPGLKPMDRGFSDRIISGKPAKIAYSKSISIKLLPAVHELLIFLLLNQLTAGFADQLGKKVFVAVLLGHD